MENKGRTAETERPAVALILPADDLGLGGVYTSVFEAAGWTVRNAGPGGDIRSEEELSIVGFEIARGRPDLAASLDPRASLIDLVYRREYETNLFGIPFHLLDNATVIIHDHDSRSLIRDILKSVNTTLIMVLHRPAVDGGRIVPEGAPKILAPKTFEGHPWLEGLGVEYIEEPFPPSIAAGSFLVAPEYGPAAWPAVMWAAASRAPVVAPGTPAFRNTMFHGALLFDPASKDDFLLKVAALRRPAPTTMTGGALRIGVVTPRFEENTAGGAENQAFRLAESFNTAGHAAEIITTCTDDMVFWNNNRPEGESTERGVTVRRFPVDRTDPTDHHRLGYRLTIKGELTWTEETDWMRLSVRSRKMEAHLRDRVEEYDCFFFVPYLFGTTYWGAQVAPEKSFLVPCYHREPGAFTGVIRQNAQWMAGVLFNTAAEKRLAQTELEIRNPVMIVAGEGVDTTAKGDPDRFREKHGVDVPFLLYVGRFQREKGIPHLLQHFRDYAHNVRSDAGLIFAGRGDMRIEDEPGENIRCLGFLPEQDKIDAYAACAAFVLPSTLESFSIVMMEAWMQGRPVIVNARCAVAREHLFTCGGGLMYANGEEFFAAVDTILNDPDAAREMGRRGREYVLKHFQWDGVIERIVSGLRAADIRPLWQRLGDEAHECYRRHYRARRDDLAEWLRHGGREKMEGPVVFDEAPLYMDDMFASINDISTLLDSAPPLTDRMALSMEAITRDIERLAEHADVSIEYTEYSHRAVIGQMWSRFREAVTRHIRTNYVELFEAKQVDYNEQTARLMKRILDEITAVEQLEIKRNAANREVARSLKTLSAELRLLYRELRKLR